MAVAGAGHQAPFPAADILQPFGLSGRRGLAGAGRAAAAVLGRAGRAHKAATVGSDRFLDVFTQVVPQMPAISDLNRVWCAVPGALSVSAGPVPADHLCARMRLQPGLQGAGFPVRQQVDRLPRGDVHQDGSVDAAIPQGEVVDPEDLRRGTDRGLGRGGDQPQQRGPVGRDAQQVPAGQPVHLLGEGDARAGRVAAEEPPHHQADHYRAAPGRAVGHRADITAVHPR